MSPPLFVFCLPGIALLCLLQVLICEAYHFHVTLSRTKRHPGDPDKDKNQESKSGRSPRDRKQQGRSDEAEDELDPEEEEEVRTHSDEEVMNPSQDGSTTSGTSQKPKVGPPRTVDFDLPEQNKGDESNCLNYGRPITNYRLQTSTDFSPFKEDRLKSRRKSVFSESYDPSKDVENLVVYPKTPEEKEWLMENLQNITLFEHLANDQITTVVDAMYKYPVSKGDYIMKQGDKGSTFYVVQTGVFTVYVRDSENVESEIHTYNNQGSFGELALLYNQPRAATIVAQTDGLLWAVDGQTFRRIVHRITYQKRMMYESLINNVPILKSLEPYERANLVDALIPMTFKHNDEIIKQGAEADGMYFIISGGVRIIMRTINDREIFLKELSNSEYFGELALVTDKPRAASAYAVGDTNLAFLDREAFERLLGPCMDVIRRHIDDYKEQMEELDRAEKP